MKVQKFDLIKLLSIIGAALFLTPLSADAQQLTGPDLNVTKTCAVNGPQSVLCTVTVKNIGQVPSVAPLTFTDAPTAPAGSTYTGAGSNTGLLIGCSPGAGPVIPIACTANKSLQPNETADALFSFKMPLPMCGTFSNIVTVKQGSNAATLPDPNPANNTNISTTLNLGICGDTTGGDKTTTICHIPPGNPNNPQTITIATSALAAHLAHGDYAGKCRDVVDSSCKPPITLSLAANTPSAHQPDFASAAWNNHVQTLGYSGINKFYLHTFNWERKCGKVTAAVLTVVLKANKNGATATSSDAGNDTIGVVHMGVSVFGEQVYSAVTKPFPAGTQVTKVWNLSGAALTNMNQTNRLSFNVQDDSSVVSATLQLTIQ